MHQARTNMSGASQTRKMYLAVGPLHIAHVVGQAQLIHFQGQTSILQQNLKVGVAHKNAITELKKKTKHQNPH